MAEKRNYLLGKGERLTEPVVPSGRKLDRVPPYTYEQARTRLAPMVRSTVDAIDALPESAKPRGQAVGSVILNPEYLAKSYYPEQILRAYGLTAVGSKPALVTPERRSKDRPVAEKPSTQLFISGAVQSFRRLAQDLDQSSVLEAIQLDLPAFEQFAAVAPESKIKGEIPTIAQVPLEIVLHASEFRSDDYIVEAFQNFLKAYNLSADLEHRLYAGGLCFLRMTAPPKLVPGIAQFSFLRAVRQLPKLRTLLPLRSHGSSSLKANLPFVPAKSESLKVAIFDGGVPENSILSPWVTRIEPPGIGPAVNEYLEHGFAVTSAFLFGTLQPGAAPQPYANIDHIRVLDVNSGSDPLELFDVLERIKNTLQSSPHYDLINLSLGPNLPIEDDDVHAWTSVLDEYLADGSCIATIAVGNDGEADSASGLNRIQVPADAVNAVSVGACDSTATPWSRATYSSIGPGRSPGIVKPDLVAFGGCDSLPYHVLHPTNGTFLTPLTGTSFAAPHSLRIAAGVRAEFGGSIEALATKALLIHTAEEGGEPQAHIGWGKVRDDLNEIVLCADGQVRVVYQGELTASKYLRAEIPLPDVALKGMIALRATCCFSTEIDSAHPSNYTRSGLEIAFRPNEDNIDPKALHAKTDSFFSSSKLFDPGEEALRSDAHKWETCLHGAVRKRASSLKRPCFDIHYLSRDEGHVDRQSHKIRYALVITVEAPKHKDLYNLIVRKYRNILEPMVPIQVPVQV